LKQTVNYVEWRGTCSTAGVPYVTGQWRQ